MQSLGFALLLLVIVFMIGAFAAAYFRNFPHHDARHQLTLIAEDRWGWTAQAVIFPGVFATTAVLWILIAWQLPQVWLRGLGLLAAVLFGVGTVLWLPISIQRLRYWAQAVELLRHYDDEAPVDVNFGGKTFWPHTYCLLAAIGLMSAVLAMSGVLPVLGWLVALLVLLSIFIAIPRWQDWPPFVTYIFLLIIAVGLMLK